MTHQSLGNPARKTLDACLDGQAVAKVPSWPDFSWARGNTARETGLRRGRRTIDAGARKKSSGAVSSAVERFVYTEDVGGSIPSPPTRFLRSRQHSLRSWAPRGAALAPARSRALRTRCLRSRRHSLRSWAPRGAALAPARSRALRTTGFCAHAGIRFAHGLRGGRRSRRRAAARSGRAHSEL